MIRIKFLYLLPKIQSPNVERLMLTETYLFMIHQQVDVDGGSMEIVYIGLTDLTHDRNFVWIDGTALDFTMWGSSDPNNYNRNEYYGGSNGPASYEFGKWYDLNQEDVNGYICKKQRRMASGKCSRFAVRKWILH